jgi:hypothetical protein
MMTMMTVALKARDDDGRKKEGGEMIRKSTEGPRDLYTCRWMMTTMMDYDDMGYQKTSENDYDRLVDKRTALVHASSIPAVVNSTYIRNA